MSESDKAVLASIEAQLIAERANPREALEAAYQLGRLQGQLEMARVGEEKLKALLEAA